VNGLHYVSAAIGSLFTNGIQRVVRGRVAAGDQVDRATHTHMHNFYVV